MCRMIGIITLICSYALLTSNCTKPDVQDDDQQGVPAYKTENIRWDFNDADGWAYAHQDTATVKQWSVENGSLYLKTRAYTRDRSKMFTLKDDFQSGTYTWRIFVSNIAPYEQASIAGFIYQDDEHELDFEIGYGSKTVRDEYEAKPDQMMACMTCQGHPFSSSYVPISPGWHTFSITLEETEGKYVAYWVIDDVRHQKLPLDFGPEEAKFRIMCSMENLLFIGDKIPEHDNVARFDYVTFEGRTAGTYVEGAADMTEKHFSVSGDFPTASQVSANVFAGEVMEQFTWNAVTGKLEGFIADAPEYHALWPYDESAQLKDGVISTYFSSTVKAYEDAASVKRLMVAESVDESFDFATVNSALALSLGESFDGVTEMVIVAESGLAGHADIRLEGLGITSDGRSLTITPEKGTTFQTGKEYYIPCLPGNHSGLKISFKGSKKIADYKLNDLQLEPGKVKNIGEISRDAAWDETRWDFTDGIGGWYYFTHSPNASQQCYSVEDGIVKIWTNANTMDRNKLHTYDENFGEGVYTFQTYVSRIAAGEKCSIGAFIYADDKHELDFEIGYGTSAARQSCNAAEDEMVACMTSQAYPFNSTYTPISVGWHTLALEMAVENGKYVARWYIDGDHRKTLNLGFGPEIKFLISISVENLNFMGDFQPTHTNYGLFDYVSYKKPVY